MATSNQTKVKLTVVGLGDVTMDQSVAVSTAATEAARAAGVPGGRFGLKVNGEVATSTRVGSLPEGAVLELVEVGESDGEGQ